MKKILLASALVGCCWAGAARAQPQAPGCKTPGSPCVQIDANTNPVPVSGTFSATLSGFAPGGSYASLTATGSSASVALPAGTVAVFYNTGTTAVSCKLGVGSATAAASEDVIQPGGAVAFTVGSNTFGACIDQTGSVSNVVAISGGAGLWSGAGGLGGGGSGGNVNLTQLNTVNLGSPSNYGTSPGAVSVAGVNAFITNTPTVTANAGTNLNTSALALETGGNLATVVTNTGNTATSTATTATNTGTTATNTGTIAGAITSSVIQANTKQVNGVTTLTGAGATGTGSQRVTVAQDTTTVAGAAPGTAGSASANVITIQGVASMTPLQDALVPQTTGGLSLSSVIVPANTTSVALKASAGQLYHIDGFSISAATPVFIKFYNAAQGSTTCGSGTPVLRYMIPGQGTGGSGFIMDTPIGIPLGTALTYCITGGIADNDTTNPAASTYVVNFLYK